MTQTFKQLESRLKTWEKSEEILRLKNEGNTDRQIHQRVGLTVKTVQQYLRLRKPGKLHPTIVNAWRRGDRRATTMALEKLAAMPKHLQLIEWKSRERDWR